MRRSSHVAWLCLASPFLVTAVAHAQALKVENAQLQDKFMVIKSVEAPSDAWLVAHKEEGGKPGDIIGFMMVKSGTNSQVQIPLAGMLQPGAGIILMLHEDAGTKGNFDPKEDKPVMEGGKPVMAEVKVE